MSNKKGKLIKKETNNKAGKYQYEIVDIETNKVVSTRKSNREYVAATLDGQSYFGRVELAQRYWLSNQNRIIVYLEQPAI
jgi:hypothetical protein